MNLNVYRHPVITGIQELDFGDNTFNTIKYLFALLILAEGDTKLAYNSFFINP